MTTPPSCCFGWVPTWWWGRLRWWRPLQVVALDGCPPDAADRCSPRRLHFSPAPPAQMLKERTSICFVSSLLPISGTVVFLFSLLQALPSCSSIHLLWSWQCWPPQWPAGPGCRCASESPSCWTSHLLRRGGDLHEVLGLICSRPEPPCSTGDLLLSWNHFAHFHQNTQLHTPHKPVNKLLLHANNHHLRQFCKGNNCHVHTSSLPMDWSCLKVV